MFDEKWPPFSAKHTALMAELTRPTTLDDVLSEVRGLSAKVTELQAQLVKPHSTVILVGDEVEKEVRRISLNLTRKQWTK